jgi:hypothetical protein
MTWTPKQQRRNNLGFKISIGVAIGCQVLVVIISVIKVVTTS